MTSTNLNEIADKFAVTDTLYRFAAGIDLKFGVTCFYLEELPMKQRALASSQQRILIADHSKFGQTRAAYIGALDQFDLLITDRAPETVFSEYAQANDIGLVIP